MTAFLSQMPTSAWIAGGVVLLPVAVILLALAIKILWGFWPVPLALGVSGWSIWRLGMEWFWLAAVGIIAGLLATWLWQRTRIFLAGDRMLERGMFLGD